MREEGSWGGGGRLRVDKVRHTADALAYYTVLILILLKQSIFYSCVCVQQIACMRAYN